MLCGILGHTENGSTSAGRIAWTPVVRGTAAGWRRSPAGLGSAPWGLAPVVQAPSVVLAGSYALAYPFWVWLGGQAVFLASGRRPSEGGVLWLYRIEDSTEEFDPSWKFRGAP